MGCCGGLLLACGSLPLTNPSPTTAKPNVLVFLVDDMGLMDTSVAFIDNHDQKGQGPQAERQPLNDYFRTPNMQDLANRGIRFSNAYAMSVCSPSRVSLMTGQNAARHHTTQFIQPFRRNDNDFSPPGWNWTGLDSDSNTLPRMLQKQGYRTIHAGKGHFAPQGFEGADIYSIGFDINIAGSHIGRPSSYSGLDDFGNGFTGDRSLRGVPGLEKYHGQDIHLSEALTLEMKQAISDAVDNKQAFFAYMSHYAAHLPFQADPRFIDNYHSGDSKPGKLAAFASLIEGMDKSLGDLLAHLDDLGVAENTLVLFMGDNGSDAPHKDREQKGWQNEVLASAPLRGKKGTAWEGGTRVPFIAAWAKADASNRHQRQFPVVAGSFESDIVSIEDLLPTIATMTGSAVEHSVDGTSLWPYFAQIPGVHRPQTFLMHFPHEHKNEYFTTYRNGDWKLIYRYKEVDKHYLFNLRLDPSESNNLASRQPERLKLLLQEMAAELDEMGAQYPLQEQHGTAVEYIRTP
jgi:arylsulfatase A-like enzyme